jgi:hypothetical protein
MVDFRMISTNIGNTEGVIASIANGTDHPLLFEREPRHEGLTSALQDPKNSEESN